MAETRCIHDIFCEGMIRCTLCKQMNMADFRRLRIPSSWGDSSTREGVLIVEYRRLVVDAGVRV